MFLCKIEYWKWANRAREHLSLLQNKHTQLSSEYHKTLSPVIRGNNDVICYAFLL